MARRGLDFVLVPAQPPTRVAMFAIRVVDAATLETLSQGVTVEAEGLRNKPIVNGSGLFVWLEEDFTALTKVSVDPGDLPFEAVERLRADLRLPPVQPPVTTVQLPPRLDYPFSSGVTGLRGRLIERRVANPEDAVPVPSAEIQLRWRTDESGDWRDSPTISHSTAEGDFASILRLGRGQSPKLDSKGRIIVQLRARLDGFDSRFSDEFALAPGRVADPTVDDPLTFFWDDFHL